MTSFNPDQVSSTAQTLMSTSVADAGGTIEQIECLDFMTPESKAVGVHRHQRGRAAIRVLLDIVLCLAVRDRLQAAATHAAPVARTRHDGCAQITR